MIRMVARLQEREAQVKVRSRQLLTGANKHFFIQKLTFFFFFFNVLIFSILIYFLTWGLSTSNKKTKVAWERVSSAQYIELILVLNCCVLLRHAVKHVLQSPAWQLHLSNGYTNDYLCIRGPVYCVPELHDKIYLLTSSKASIIKLLSNHEKILISTFLFFFLLSEVLNL